MGNLLPYHFHGLGNPASTLFGDDFLKPFFYGDAVPVSFRADVRDEGENYVIEAELPGVKRENLRIDVADGMLTISAEWKNDDKGQKNGEYLVSERRAGRVQRSFSLDNVVEDAITADYGDGILTVKLPKRDEVRRTPRRIELS